VQASWVTQGEGVPDGLAICGNDVGSVVCWEEMWFVQRRFQLDDRRGVAADYSRCWISSGAAGYFVSAVFLELVWILVTTRSMKILAAILLCFYCRGAAQTEFLKPDGLSTPKGYTHVVIAIQERWCSSQDKSPYAQGQLVGKET